MGIPNSTRALFLAAAGQATGGAYEISRSLRFNLSDSAYLSRTPASGGNRRTWTWSGWVKRTLKDTGAAHTLLSTGESNANNGIYFAFSANQISIGDWTTAYVWRLITTAVYRDSSAWYHIVLAVDTTQSTSSNRVKVYINGIQESSFSTANYPTQNYDTQVNQASKLHAIGRYGSYNGGYLDAYLADIHFIDGQALDPTSFGEFDANGVWQPIEYTGTYPGNSFHLPFSDNSTAAALGTDTSSNGNDWTVNNISVTAGSGNDSLVDTPTNGSQTDTGVGGEVVGNYATLNPLNTGGSLIAISNGNLDFTGTGAGAGRGNSTLSMRPGDGKFYSEMTCTSTAQYNHPGIYADSVSVTSDSNRIVYRQDGNVYVDGSLAQTITAFTNGDVIGMAFDADTRQLTYYKNGSLVGGPYQASTPPSGGGYYYHILTGSQTGCSGSFNFGQRPFAYTAPSGYKALCTANLPDPVVAQPSTVMDVALYTGTGSTQTISGLGFSPDLVWIKNRNISGYWHELVDSVRGVSRRLFSNDTSAEDFRSGQGLTAFNSDGFTLTYVDGNDNGNNSSGNTFVAWTWDAGSNTVSNTDGSITSQVRANPSAGFSIVTYTGTQSIGTVGHGLNIAPQMFIVKSRDSSFVDDWRTYHVGINDASKYLKLSSTAAATTGTTTWNSTDPSSNVFTLGSGTTVNKSGDRYVAYCFAPVEGYSAFGSYTGNGSADGPFVFTGMRPRWILTKCSSLGGSGQNWFILDTTRNTYNPVGQWLRPNLSGAETTYNSHDILSNGFKVRDTDNALNGSGQTYIYAAFSENPFKTARAR